MKFVDHLLIRLEKNTTNWIIDLDDFNKDAVRRSIQELYDRGKYPTYSKIRGILKGKIVSLGGGYKARNFKTYWLSV